MPTYRLHDTTGDDLGVIEHPAPNLEPGDVVVIPDEREALDEAPTDGLAELRAVLLREHEWPVRDGLVDPR